MASPMTLAVSRPALQPVLGGTIPQIEGPENARWYVPAKCTSRRTVTRAGVPSPGERASSRAGLFVPIARKHMADQNVACQAISEGGNGDESRSAGKMVARWLMPVALALVMESSGASLLAPPDAKALPLGSQADQEQVTKGESNALTFTKSFAQLDSLFSDQLKPLSRGWFLAAATPPAAKALTLTFPKVSKSTEVMQTIQVDGVVDYKMQAFRGGAPLGGTEDEEEEDQLPIFELKDGSVLKNVIIVKPGVDGIHCKGTCTLENVWWLDVGEDAASQKGKEEGQVMTVLGGGARSADDKVFQHNGPGTLIIKDFVASDIGKLYRSCGTCTTQFDRHVEIDNVLLEKLDTSIVGINVNNGDTAEMTNVTLINTKEDVPACRKYKSTRRGEPKEVGSGPDDKFCKYSESSITRK